MRRGGRVWGYVRLARPHYSLMMPVGLLVLLAYRVNGWGELGWDAVWAYGATAAMLAGAYCYNDVRDRCYDRVNSPGRPLVRGELWGKTAAVAWHGAALVMGWQVNVVFTAVLAGVGAVLVGYNVYSKRLGLMKDVVVAGLMVSLYVLAAAVTAGVESGRRDSLMLSWLWLGLSSLGYEMLKDARDCEGDAAAGAGGIARHSGSRWFEKTGRWLVVTGTLWALVPYVLGQTGWVYLVFVTAAGVCSVWGCWAEVRRAIRLGYASVLLVTCGAGIDIMVV